MGLSIPYHPEPADLDVEQVCQAIVSTSQEDEFLGELADELGRTAIRSENADEATYCVEAARRLRELAKWMEENSP